MMKKFEQDKIILAYTAIIDSSKLGYYTYRVYLRFRSVNTFEEKEKFYQFLSNLPETTIVNSIDGYWNVGFAISVKNIYDFYEVWNKIMSKRKNIADYKIAIYSPIFHFTRTLLAPEPKKETPKILTLGGKEFVDHSSIDLEILKLLSKNVRQPIIELAKKLHKNPKFISNRIKYLEKTQIIQGYRPLLDWGKLGYSYYKIDFTLTNYSSKNDLFELCRMHPNVIQVNQTIGGSDFEFEIFCKDTNELFSIISEIQNKFSHSIENYTYFSIPKPYKETFMSI
jgi:DNA-binding Lrp family transcriptional regulator